MTKKRQEKNWLEWSVFAAGLVLTLGLVSTLIWESAARETGPVRCVVTIGDAERDGAVHRLPVRVENRGGSSAENVHVEVSLVRGSETIETATVDLTFLPRGSVREGAVEFTSDPGKADAIRARCAGYETP